MKILYYIRNYCYTRARFYLHPMDKTSSSHLLPLIAGLCVSCRARGSTSWLDLTVGDSSAALWKRFKDHFLSMESHRRDVWMDGWMRGWMCGWTGGETDGRTDWYLWQVKSQKRLRGFKSIFSNVIRILFTGLKLVINFYQCSGLAQGTCGIRRMLKILWF